MRLRELALLVITLGATACVSSRVPRQFCTAATGIDAIAATIDPDGHLQSPDVPETLQATVLRYLWGQICGRPACDLYRGAEDIKACKDGYLSTRSLLRRKIKIVYIGVDRIGGAAAIEISAANGSQRFTAHFRRSDDGSWFVFEPLWEAGVGVP